MKANFVFVPPGGGEADYSLIMEVPELPKQGDYISIHRNEEALTSDFIVRRTWWHLSYNESSDAGSLSEAVVECEFALSPSSSENHKKSCQMYESRKGKLLHFDETAY